MSYFQVSPHIRAQICAVAASEMRYGWSASLLVDVDGELLAAVNEKEWEVMMKGEKRFTDDGKYLSDKKKDQIKEHQRIKARPKNRDKRAQESGQDDRMREEEQHDKRKGRLTGQHKRVLKCLAPYETSRLRQGQRGWPVTSTNIQNTHTHTQSDASGRRMRRPVAMRHAPLTSL